MLRKEVLNVLSLMVANTEAPNDQHAIVENLDNSDHTALKSIEQKCILHAAGIFAFKMSYLMCKKSVESIGP